MDKIKDYEDSLNNADEIYFHTTDNYEKSPSAVKLGFNNPENGIHGYAGIHKLFDNSETTLIIFKSENTVDISIVSKDSADTINIKNLKYDQENLQEYSSSEPASRKLVLLIGPKPASSLDVYLPTGLTRPLVIDKYSIVQRP